MRKTSLSLKKTRVNGALFWQVTLPKLGGGRERRTFKERAEAQTYLELSKVQVQNFGNAALSIPDALRVEAVECSQRLREFNKTLRDATDFYIQHLRAVEKSVSVADAMNELVKARKASGRSKRYCKDLELRLKRFQQGFPSATVATITAREIDGWLAGLALAPGTRNTFRRDIRTLFSFCEKRGYCKTNEAKNTERATDVDKPVSILTPIQASNLLNACGDDILPYVAISLFAGLRAAELQKLDWAEIDLTGRHIEVTAQKSKTQRRRLVPISDNLRAWLKPLVKKAGPVAPAGLRKRFDAVKEAAGFKAWESNAMRHSYGSYRLAQCQDAAKVSLEMGNSPQMVFAHYREIVRPKNAVRYWKIRPAAAQNVVAMAA